MLYQNQDGVDQVIGFASRTLSKTKHKYLAHKLEFLAFMWVITEQFHEYNYSNTSVINTDNNPLTYILNWCKTGCNRLSLGCLFGKI